jgi:hypothetical protein
MYCEITERNIVVVLPLYNNWFRTLDSHGGGDWRLVSDFLAAVDARDPNLLTSTIDASVESHLMGFDAEKLRLQSL